MTQALCQLQLGLGSGVTDNVHAMNFMDAGQMRPVTCLEHTMFTQVGHGLNSAHAK